MKKDTQATLTTLGSGLAAGAAGYGASKAMGADGAGSLAAGVSTALLAATLAHLISKKTTVDTPLAGPFGAGAASAFTGTTSAVGALGAGAWLDDKYGKQIESFIPDMLSKGTQSKNSFIKSLASVLEKYNNSLGGSIKGLGIPKKGPDGKMIHPGIWAKAAGKMLRNKKAALAGLTGLTVAPITYSLLRGNGSD